MMQIFPVILVELAKSVDYHFFCNKLALQKVLVSRKYKSSQEISSILCQMVCYRLCTERREASETATEFFL